jgi:hypothetical protein
VFFLVILGLIAMAGVTAAQQPGNDGTVKIHDGATGAEPIVRNEPHVSTFHVHFFFADPTQSGSWEIRAWAPGDKGSVVLSGTYDTSADGSDREPAQGEYTLPSGHYKLFWDGRNAHNVKHKTFWVSGPAPTGTGGPTGSVAPTGSLAPTGSVAALTGAPTLPPTDGLAAGEVQVGGSLMPVLGILIGIVGLALLLTPRRAAPRR